MEIGKSGITLIALIITVIILLILAGVTLSFIINDNGILSKAEQAVFKTRWAEYKENTQLYVVAQMGIISAKDINAGEKLKELIEKEAEVDIKVEDVNTNMQDVVENIDQTDEPYAVVYHGELCYVLDDRNKHGEKHAKWCLEIGIPVLELKRPSGTENKKGDYEFVNGVYLNTPKLDMGFDKNYTRYVNLNENGVMEPGDWIFSKPQDDWYDYKKGKWANIVTENKGIECYYTWIPRYCFKLDNNTQRSDVKFIDINNNYKDPYTDEEIEWKTLEKQGYQVPEAFNFDGQELLGYWAMKYDLGESPTPSIIYYDMKVTSGIITISNIQVNGGENISKYVVNLNSQKQEEVNSVAGKTFVLENMRAGDNVINITGLDSNGEMIGSYTRVYATSELNPPDLTGFNKDTTFYVLYDENGKEHSTIPITDPAPLGWYNYDESEWANIVTRNNGGEIYYTWIPRYEFTLDNNEQRSDVKFVLGTKGATDENRTGVTSGYKIPEAFSFDGKELTGFWAMKYDVGESNTTIFDATAVATSESTITVQGVTGTGTGTSGLKYNYYINDKPRDKDTKPYKTTTNAKENVTFEGLTAGKEYTILIEVRSSDDSYVATVIKKTEILMPNAPVLTGFNPDCTYYVLYDDSGKESIGDKIKKDGSNMPKNWYNYSKSKWANIVVKGKKTDGTETATYFTWIPRYEFKLDSQTQRSDVRFIEGTKGGTGDNRDGVTQGYQVPAAFNFDGKELEGYWTMKYDVADQ